MRASEIAEFINTPGRARETFDVFYELFDGNKDEAFQWAALEIMKMRLRPNPNLPDDMLALIGGVGLGILIERNKATFEGV